MKIISPKIHAYLDYIFAAILILFPWIFGYELKEADSWLPLIIGLFVLTSSVLTRFKHEHFGIIPLKTHLVLDIFLGVVLAIGPWLGEVEESLPYLQTILGALIILAAAMTQALTYGNPEKKITQDGV
jgi:hypothetical protein